MPPRQVMEVSSERELALSNGKAPWQADEVLYGLIHTAVLTTEIEHGLLASSTLPPAEYNALLDEFQHAATGLVLQLREQGYPVAECEISGDVLRLCFYDPREVERNYQLDGPHAQRGEQRRATIEDCRRHNRELALHALRAAVLLKSLWLTRGFNLRRVLGRLEPWELRIALHYGCAQLGQRADDTRRIEGHTLAYARQLASSVQQPLYSRILASPVLHNVLCSSVVKHTLLRQRVFFHEHRVPGLPGLPGVQQVHELRFCHRAGIPVDAEAIEQYEALFNLNQANMWAYSQLIEHYAYVQRDWNRVFALAKSAQLAHPQDEKVLLDLAKYYLEQGKPEQSREFALQALRLNDSFDLAHEHLAVIAAKLNDGRAHVEHCRAALRLSPGSPVNNFNLGLALLYEEKETEGFHYIQEAVRLNPSYKDSDSFIGALLRIRREGKLPELLEAYLSDEGQEL